MTCSYTSQGGIVCGLSEEFTNSVRKCGPQNNKQICPTNNCCTKTGDCVKCERGKTYYYPNYNGPSQYNIVYKPDSSKEPTNQTYLNSGKRCYVATSATQVSLQNCVEAPQDPTTFLFRRSNRGFESIKYPGKCLYSIDNTTFGLQECLNTDLLSYRRH